MINDTMKERIWRIINTVRGVNDEAYQMLIYVLFLKYISEYKDRLELGFDEKYSIEYLALLYGKVVDKDVVENFIIDIEEQLFTKNNCISSNISMWLTRSKDEEVRYIFDAVNNFRITDTDEYYKLALYLLNDRRFIDRSSRDITTNHSLAYLESKLLNCKENMTVYDACCGSAISINEAVTDGCTVYAGDINSYALGVATILTVLKGNTIGGLYYGDTLLKPIEPEMKFDRIVCEPPIGLRPNKAYFDDIPDGNIIYKEINDNDTLFLRHVLARLKNDGLAVVLVSMGTLFKAGRVGKAREKLVLDRKIDAVIELPEKILSYSSVKTALLVLKNNKDDNRVFMIDTSRTLKNSSTIQEKNRIDFTFAGIDNIIDIYVNKKEIEGISAFVTIKELADNQFNLSTYQYVQKELENEIEIGNISDYIDNYLLKAEQLEVIDKELKSLRSRFTKGAKK